MNKLKNCPFCGHGDVEYHDSIPESGIFGMFGSVSRTPSITCPGCGIGFEAGTYFRGITEEEMNSDVMEKWNNRAHGPDDK